MFFINSVQMFCWRVIVNGIVNGLFVLFLSFFTAGSITKSNDEFFQRLFSDLLRFEYLFWLKINQINMCADNVSNDEITRLSS